MEKIEIFWNPVKGVKIQEIEPCLYTFQFNHHLDFQRILKKGPWYFDNHLLVLDILLENGKPDQAVLNSVPFWIQVHDIPSGYMTEKTGKDIRNYIGEFLEYDAKNNSNYLRAYMRIRVLLDITKPLKRQKKIKKQGGDSSFIKFKYECLGNFCYYCGCLGHIEDYCEKLYSIESDDGTRLWGPELRVEKHKKTRGGGGTRRNPVHSSNISSPATVTVPGQGSTTLNAESKTIKSDKLAQLVRNPQLFLPQNSPNEKLKDNGNADIIEEENNLAIISSKPKRSRSANDENQGINVTLTQHTLPAEASHGTAHSELISNNKPDSHDSKATPMDVTQSSTSFLSAEPGSQACRAQ